MKKEYTQPTIELIELVKEDVITTSGVMGELLPGDKPIEW